MGKILYTGLVCPQSEEYVHTPLIHILPPHDEEALEVAAAALGDDDILLFTSRFAVRYWSEAMRRAQVGWGGSRIVSIGDTTTRELIRQGAARVEQVAIDNSYGVIEHFRHIAPDHSVVFPRSEIALPLIPDGLRAMGFEVKVVTAYRNVMPAEVRRVDLHEIDTIVFTSPSTVDRFLELYGALPVDKEYRTRGLITQNYLNKKRENEKI